MLNDTISGSEIHNKNEKANIFNDNELEINQKSINIEIRKSENIPRKSGKDIVSPSTSKYRRVIRPK